MVISVASRGDTAKGKGTGWADLMICFRFIRLVTRGPEQSTGCCFCGYIQILSSRTRALSFLSIQLHHPRGNFTFRLADQVFILFWEAPGTA